MSDPTREAVEAAAIAAKIVNRHFSGECGIRPPDENCRIQIEAEIKAALLAAQSRAPGEGEWRPIESAPKDGSEFLAIQNGEYFRARYDNDYRPPRLMYRTHSLFTQSRYRVISTEMDGKKVCAQVEIDKPWPEEFCHNWTLWERGFEFDPTHWQPLPAPPGQAAAPTAPSHAGERRSELARQLLEGHAVFCKPQTVGFADEDKAIFFNAVLDAAFALRAPPDERGKVIAGSVKTAFLNAMGCGWGTQAEMNFCDAADGGDHDRCECRAGLEAALSHPTQSGVSGA